MKHYPAKAFFATLVFSLFTAAGHAQTMSVSSEMPEPKDLKLFEFEMACGINFAPRWDELRAKPGGNFIVELRLNRPEPFDFGLQLKMGNFIHSERDVYKVNSVFIRPTLFFDYNHRFSNTVLFGGIGVGGSFIQNNTVIHTSPYGGLMHNGSDRHFAVKPRMGIVIMGFFRITAEYVFTHRDYSCFDINFGFVVGGSYKPAPAQKRRNAATFREY